MPTTVAGRRIGDFVTLYVGLRAERLRLPGPTALWITQRSFRHHCGGEGGACEGGCLTGGGQHPPTTQGTDVRGPSETRRQPPRSAEQNAESITNPSALLRAPAHDPRCSSAARVELLRSYYGPPHQ